MTELWALLTRVTRRHGRLQPSEGTDSALSIDGGVGAVRYTGRHRAARVESRRETQDEPTASSDV